MTTVPFVFRGSWQRLRLARARLALGMTAVGTCALLALTLVGFNLPARLLSTSAAQPWWMAMTGLGLTMAYGIIAFAPFDLIGGAMFVRHSLAPAVWFAQWSRGVIVQWLVWMTSAAGLLASARLSGVVGAFGFFVISQLLLAAVRGRLATLVARMPRREVPEPLRSAATGAGLAAAAIEFRDAADEGFVGGWSGIAATTLIVPARWSAFPASTLVAAITRRRVVAESGAHLRGVLGAIAWNVTGFVLVLWLTRASLASSAGILTMAAGMTLWAFAGVLLLPTPSRWAVYWADRAAANIAGVQSVSAAIETLDRLQDDEPIRSGFVETIFHPVPARSARLARLANPAPFVRWPALHTHHIARHALWLNWAALTPISRAVHCNVGRPSLWVMLPGD